MAKCVWCDSQARKAVHVGPDRSGRLFVCLYHWLALWSCDEPVADEVPQQAAEPKLVVEMGWGRIVGGELFLNPRQGDDPSGRPFAGVNAGVK